MKTRMITAVLIFFIAASVLTAGSSKKMMTIDEAMEIVCGTWINTDYSGTPCQRAVFHSDETYELFIKVSDTTPVYTWVYTIKEAWTDRNGNIWMKTTSTQYDVPKQIYKISNSGTVLEIASFAGTWPEIEEIDSFRVIYYRQE